MKRLVQLTLGFLLGGLITAGAVMAIVDLQAQDPTDPLLSNMEITFRTGNDDKDTNTRLEIFLIATKGSAAYTDVGNNDHFPNGSTRTFNVPTDPKGKPMHKSDVTGSYIQLVIMPRGHDTWRFGFDATLNFADNSTPLQYTFDGNALDQDSRVGRYPIALK